MVCAAAGKSLSVSSNAMRMLLSVGPDAIGDAIAGASVGGGATWLVMGAAAGAVSTTFSGGDGGDGAGRRRLGRLGTAVLGGSFEGGAGGVRLSGTSRWPPASMLSSST